MYLPLEFRLFLILCGKPIMLHISDVGSYLSLGVLLEGFRFDTTVHCDRRQFRS